MPTHRRALAEAGKLHEAHRMAAALATQAHDENDAVIMATVRTDLAGPGSGCADGPGERRLVAAGKGTALP